LQVLKSTPNSFTLSWPAFNRSLTIDKLSLKAEEHDLEAGDNADTISDKVCGFLGIL